LKYAAVAELVAGIPHTTPEKGLLLYDAVLRNRFSRCLELGFACGVGSSYIAAALDENNVGSLVSVDLPVARDRKPQAPDLLKRIGLSHRVSFVFHELGYNWYLMAAIEAGQRFDFCFLDGAHTWDVDGLAFALLDLVLVPGGMIVFDDLDWTYATSPTLANVPAPEQMRQTPGIRKVVELLVKPHPNFQWIEEKYGLGIACKRSKSEGPPAGSDCASKPPQ
jgi:predicted O-methyltransferase YrrM